MTIAPVWKITGTQVLNDNDKENVVSIVEYQISATKNGKAFSYSSNVKIEYADGNFIEFENLSESQMLDWVWQSLGSEKDKILNRMEEELDKQPVTPITNIKPVSLMPPWVKVSL
jgi:hypothetical protein